MSESKGGGPAQELAWIHFSEGWRPVVLLVEDSVTCGVHLASRLRHDPYYAHVEIARTLRDARVWLVSPEAKRLTLAVLDYELPDGKGTDLLPLLPCVPVLVVTSQPENVPRFPNVAVIRKGPTWAVQVEAALVRAQRGT